MPIEIPRRGRSDTEFAFEGQPLASPIRTDTLWLDTLVTQNEFASWCEDHDPVYRGDLPPGHFLAGHFNHPFDRPDGIGENEDQLHGDTHPSTPEPDTRPVTPEPASLATRSLERFSSPMTPLPASRSVSPTLTDVANGWPPTFYTYTRADHKRFLRYRAERKAEAAAQAEKAKASKRAKAAELARKCRARVPAHPTRQSARLLHSDGPKCTGIINVEAAAAIGHVVHTVDPDAITPIVNPKDLVIGIIAGPPKGDSRWWVQVNKHAEQAMSRLYRNGQFDNLGREESHVRFGIGYGGPGAYPHHIYCVNTTNQDFRFLQNSNALRAMSAYQNHLYRQIAPRAYAKLKHQIGVLKARTTLHPAFPGIFTTSEIAFADGPQHSRRNREIQYDTLEAVTICGDYEWNERGRIIFWDHDRSVPLRPSTTLLFPAGAMHFSFVGVAAHEKVCLFRQFFHASILRWLEKDGRSDTQFELMTSEEDLAAFKAVRVTRPVSTIQLYSKIGEIYVV
ncbi:hypothetical protein DFH07DRAFT_962314 [Mycena maculata]|uniref:Uncharacterized protein n=1 Tax=Mycena maculata TaxID=230809 RepID=A0AAD7N7M4_9AGAR|nr:hypothetical protein DFH07DRAFT_962314 [Mycena maculata]